MRRLLCEMLLATEEPDYVEHFQRLAHVNLEIGQGGPTCERLLRKSILERDVGNYHASVEAATQASLREPQNAEAHYQAAMAAVHLAFVRAGALPPGPGQGEVPRQTIFRLVQSAAERLGEAIRLRPEDLEAVEDLEALNRFLAGHDGEPAMRQALCEQAL
jgi:hypothetical protein